MVIKKQFVSALALVSALISTTALLVPARARAEADAGTGALTGEYPLAAAAALRKDEFVRNIDCPQFANLVLEGVGLPVIGLDEPVVGTRGDLNRNGQLHNPPRFEDSVIASRAPYLEYRVRAFDYPSRPRDWSLELTRRVWTNRKAWWDVRTRFDFTEGSVHNKSVCEISSIRFEAPGGSLTGSYDANRCLSLFDPKAPRPTAPADKTLWPWLQSDCALALRFFAAMKYPRLGAP